MALLKAVSTDNRKVTFMLRAETVETLEVYAQFLPAPKEQVVDQALAYIFRKDRQFQKYLQEKGGKPAVKAETKKTGND